MKKGIALYCAVIGGFLATTALAAENEPPVVDLAKGTRTFTLSAGYVRERRDTHINLANAAAGFGLYVLDNVAVEVQVLGYRTFDEEPGAAIGSSLVGRWHFLNIDRFSLFGEVAGGLFQGTEDFPDGGTHFNFTYRGGPGASFKLNDGLYLIGAFNFQHVSNGFIEGRDKNPIFNSFGGHVGLMWTF